MQELDDNALLRQYVEQNSGEAFSALVNRHVNKVYSAALRHTGNPSQAEEITQAVFVILATKAARLGKGVILSGWLYHTARLTALTHIRSEIRRNHREQEAYMETSSNENERQVWNQIAPMLDTAMAGLNETDRTAVVLRFFDGKSNKEVGTALGASESAAEKRISRALDKLRNFFQRRGVTSTTAILSGAISANAVQAAPLALAQSITATASITNSALAKATLFAMKTKTAITVAVTIVLLGAGAFFFFHPHTAPASSISSASPALPVHLDNAIAKRDRNDLLFVIDTDPGAKRTSESAPSMHIKGPVQPSTPPPPNYSDATMQEAGNSDSLHYKIDKDSPLLGKHIRITGWLKCAGVQKRATAYMCMYSEKNGFVRFDDMGSRPALTGTADWQQVEFVTDVPNEPCFIFTGPDLYGPGEMWGDDFEIFLAPPDALITDDRSWHHSASDETAYTGGLDFSTQHDGHSTICMTYVSADPAAKNSWSRWAKMLRDEDLRKYAGHKMQITGMVKTEDVSVRFEPRIRPWKWVNGTGAKLLATDSMARDYTIKGTHDWTPFTVTCKIPADTQKVDAGFLLWGSGKVWIDTSSVKIAVK